jgi:flagellar biosynthetic protein FlhB
MNEETESSRTEEASAYKLEQARRKGMVARSLEFSTLLLLLAFAGFAWAFGSRIGGDLQRLMAGAVVQAPSLAYGPLELWTWTAAVASRAGHVIVPLMLLLAAAAALAVLLQVGFVFSPQALKPDFSRLNPVNGFKRIFSLQALFELGKTLLKLAVYPAIAVLVVLGAARYASNAATEPSAVASLIADSGVRLLFWLLAGMVIFAAIDVLFVRRQYARKMMMSRREMREEVRHREGDPRIKQRRRHLSRELLKRARALRQLRGSDVLITNPTHFAVALKFDAETMLAPKVVSKGAGEFAQRLKRLAFVYGVATIEDKALARALYFGVPIDAEIPEKFFKPTAAIYVRLRRARDGQSGAESAPAGA